MKKFSDFKFNKINEQEITLNTGVSDEEKEETTEETTETTEVENSEVEQTQTEVVETPESNGGVKLFSKLFESSEMARVYHLQASNEGSYAAHKALDEYYGTITGLTDELIETYSGQYGIVEGYQTIDMSDTKTKDRLQYFEELVKFTTDGRYTLLSEKDAHLQSLVDVIVCLMYRTIYKLKFLK